jgi:probable HAF family extracellular repeat protein
MRTMIPAVVLVALTACRDDQPMTQPSGSALALSAAERRYDVIRLPALGGSDTRAQAINNDGLVAGFSHDADGRRRAVLWPNHQTVISLGTLGGPHSAVVRPGFNSAGILVGISHITEVDPNEESWSCEFTASLPETDPRLACRGFWWENGVMSPLPTLGGTHGFANSVNESGLAVGWAETAVVDPTCTGDQKLQFHGVLWDLKNGITRALRPFPGDSSAAATGINSRGQVVGISGDCDQAAGRFSAKRAVLWEGDQIIELPNLGGGSWHTPWAINARGDVVGFGNPEDPDNLAGDFRGRAWYWRHGSASVIPLGVLDGGLFSQANGINASGLMIGLSNGGPPGLRGVIWELDTNGEPVITDLNTLIDLESDEIFELAADLNDAGQIVGRIRNLVTNVRTAVVLIPRED